ncbi:LysM peptidoglycan-binding domain-containing protein [Desulfoscipio geothermicus]|uniref:LysM domain-containing protein n=1 Tax=Desulfoscipio geothermicus DSM 3669 TaxID=1121426 RepID=A0A1I6CRS8_9FIRM|nr:LysM domain-containing protein [Desulfoscipio geothermicus]SFQ95817.1 LysM domain-containing protein [Desulfoscipio geothermicus DSM 3669]
MKISAYEGKVVKEIEESINKNKKLHWKAILYLSAGVVFIFLLLTAWNAHQETVILKTTVNSLKAENNVLKKENITLKEELRSYRTKKETSQNKYIYYEIKQNDTLGSISLHYYGTEIYAAKLAEMNGLTVNSTLRVGQVIKVPKKPDK